MAGKITTILAKKEAETYCLHGLHKEALTIYRKLLSTSPSIDPAFKAGIENQIKKISDELESDDLKEVNRLTAADIVRVKKGWGEDATESDMLICAQAFHQIGYYKEALLELVSMLKKGCGTERISTLLADCLAQLFRPTKVVGALEKFSRDSLNHPEDRFHLSMILAEELATLKRPHHAIAIVDYLQAQSSAGEQDAQRLIAIAESIGPLDPEPPEEEPNQQPPDAEKAAPKNESPPADTPDPPSQAGNKLKTLFRWLPFYRKKT